MEIIKFGGTPKEQKYLSNLVLTGLKTATSSLYDLQTLNHIAPTIVGDIWYIHDDEDSCVCKVKVTAVDLVPFGEVKPAFAISEGDKTYENWYEIHFAYYSSLLSKLNRKLSSDTLLECVYFETTK